MAATPVSLVSTAAPCVEASGQRLLPDYRPSLEVQFTALRDGAFVVGDTLYRARGVNYYPARYPWRRFLTAVDLNSVHDELLLLRTVGFNTLRLFLWNAALFDCEGKSTRPHAEAFARLDAIIHAAADQGFRLIVTLNDLPDEAIYTNPDYLQQQTRFIVERYRDEAAILAWDLRNEGDIDYGSNDAFGRGKVEKAVVIDWLEQTAALVRELDANHLITAGWLKDNEATAPHVDFISFHHWEDSGMLRERIKGLRAAGKPILLEEFGYSTFRVSPEEQSRVIAEAVAVTEAENLLGWLVWAAFDFPLDATCIQPACPSQDNAEHHFGLWFTDYMPKPVVQVLLER